MSRQRTLTERMLRCTKQPVPLADFDVTEGDDERQRRVKWNFRAMFVRYAPCSNGPHCPRCVASFLDAFNQPIGPWA